MLPTLAFKNKTIANNNNTHFILNMGIINLIINLFKTVFSSWRLILKTLKIILLLGFLWFVFGYLNNKFGLLTPFKAILKAVYTGIKGALSLIGIG